MDRGREVRYDVIRVVAMLFVIAVHVNPKPFNSFPWFKDVFDYIIYTCNGMFFMLSGFFNMKKEFKTKEDYTVYYEKKVISILLPYVLMTFLLYGYDYYQSGRDFQLRLFVEERNPEIISGSRFYMGSLINDRLWRLDDPEVIKIIVNMISYAMIRDEYREHVKSNKRK